MRRWVILVLALGAGAACSGGESPEGGAELAAGDVASTSVRSGASAVRAARAAAEGGVVYVDVRTPREFAAGHVEGAILIPHTEMAGRWRELEAYRDRPMVVYCRTGRRSGIALRILREQGFERAENGGGLSDLARRGAAVTR